MKETRVNEFVLVLDQISLTRDRRTKNPIVVVIWRIGFLQGV